jgi:N-sulfoglucosamine sulfohydrolase
MKQPILFAALAFALHLPAPAATAHKFVNNHVTVPICQPGRSAFMTGRVPHRNGALGFNPIKPGTPTLTSVLRAAGYFTGVMDKHAHMKPDAEFNWDVKLGGSGKNPEPFCRHFEQLLKAAADAKKPFFINANITDPHRPFYASEQLEAQKAKKNKKTELRENEGTIKPFTPEDVTVPSYLEDIPQVRREVAQYYSSVRRFDASFGGIMAALKATGREADTVVIFLSDHGMSFPFSKATVYRNGTWVPVLVRWPGMGQPQRREEFVSSVDIVPTLLEVLKQPPLAGVDGRSWLPLLRGESQPDRDFVITHVNTVSSGKSFPQRCVRTKDFSYQFHAWPDGTPHFRVEAMNGLSFAAMNKAAETDATIKGRVTQLLVGAPEQFFDLRADPDERVNLIVGSKHAAEIARLKKLLLAHMEKTEDPQLENFRKVIVAK